LIVDHLLALSPTPSPPDNSQLCTMCTSTSPRSERHTSGFATFRNHGKAETKNISREAYFPFIDHLVETHLQHFLVSFVLCRCEETFPYHPRGWTLICCLYGWSLVEAFAWRSLFPLSSFAQNAVAMAVFLHLTDRIITVLTGICFTWIMNLSLSHFTGGTSMGEVSFFLSEISTGRRLLGCM